MKYRKWVLDSLIILGITLILLVVLEGALRLIYPDKVTEVAESNEEASDPYEYEAHYIRTIKPNIHSEFTRSLENGGDVILWKSNEHRFRGNDLLGNPDVRVIVYGDSNIQARFSHLKKTFPYRLQENLKELTGKDVEVINAGVIGFGPDQSLIRFSLEADIYKPDIVVFHVFADNDFGDLIRNQLFTLDSSGSLIKMTSEPVNAVSEPVNATSNLALLWKELSKKLSGLMIVSSAKEWKKMLGLESGRRGRSKHTTEEQFQKIISASEKDYKSYKEGKRTGGDHYDIDIALHPKNESSKVQMSLMNKVLRKSKIVADSKNIQFMVLIQPSSRDLSTNLRLNYKYFTRYPNYKRNSLTDAVNKACIHNEISCLNLFKIFARNNPDAIYFKDGNDHWNDAGQELAAKETAKYIYKNMLN